MNISRYDNFLYIMTCSIIKFLYSTNEVKVNEKMNQNSSLKIDLKIKYLYILSRVRS